MIKSMMVLLMAVSAWSSARASELPSSSVYHLNSSWTDQDGRSLAWPSLRGKVQVLAFLYTGCGASCPVLAAQLKEIQSRLSASDRSRVGFVLVSIDPTSDSPRKLKAFAKSKSMTGPEWLLLHGSGEEVADLAAATGFKYRRLSSGVIAHSNLILVLNSDGVVQHRQETLDGAAETSKALNEVLHAAN